jgi:diphthine synthase
MLYLIGLGLNVKGISKQGLEIVKRCKRIYLESYTVDFPYSLADITEIIGKRIIPANREKIEGLSIIDEAKKMDIALLIYGSPLTATTHITLLQEAKKSRVKCKIIYNASILDAVAETGLQLYKFGKIASMPLWDKEKKFTPDSFMKIVQENQSIKAHSLILIDIGLKFQDALKQLEESAKKYEISFKKIVLCEILGTSKRKISYKIIDELKDYKGVRSPYCIILPSNLHFLEKEHLSLF